MTLNPTPPTQPEQPKGVRAFLPNELDPTVFEAASRAADEA